VLGGTLQLTVYAAIQRGANQPVVADPQRHCTLWHLAQSIMSAGICFWFRKAGNLQPTAFPILTTSFVVWNTIFACLVLWSSCFAYCGIAGMTRSLPWIFEAVLFALCLCIGAVHGLVWLPFIFWSSIALTPILVKIIRRLRGDLVHNLHLWEV
jgi:hypothetical protein